MIRPTVNLSFNVRRVIRHCRLSSRSYPSYHAALPTSSSNIPQSLSRIPPNTTQSGNSISIRAQDKVSDLVDLRTRIPSLRSRVSGKLKRLTILGVDFTKPLQVLTRNETRTFVQIYSCFPLFGWTARSPFILLLTKSYEFFGYCVSRLVT